MASDNPNTVNVSQALDYSWCMPNPPPHFHDSEPVDPTLARNYSWWTPNPPPYVDLPQTVNPSQAQNYSWSMPILPPYFLDVYYDSAQIFGGSAGHTNRWVSHIPALMARLQTHPIVKFWIFRIGLAALTQLIHHFILNKMYTRRPLGCIIPSSRPDIANYISKIPLYEILELQPDIIPIEMQLKLATMVYRVVERGGWDFSYPHIGQSMRNSRWKRAAQVEVKIWQFLFCNDQKSPFAKLLRSNFVRTTATSGYISRSRVNGAFREIRNLKNGDSHRNTPITISEFLKVIGHAIVLMMLFGDEERTKYFLRLVSELREWETETRKHQESTRAAIEEQLMEARGGKNEWGGTECLFSFKELGENFGERRTLRMLESAEYTLTERSKVFLQRVQPLFDMTEERIGISKPFSNDMNLDTVSDELAGGQDLNVIVADANLDNENDVSADVDDDTDPVGETDAPMDLSDTDDEDNSELGRIITVKLRKSQSSIQGAKIATEGTGGRKEGVLDSAKLGEELIGKNFCGTGSPRQDIDHEIPAPAAENPSHSLPKEIKTKPIKAKSTDSEAETGSMANLRAKKTEVRRVEADSAEVEKEGIKKRKADASPAQKTTRKRRPTEDTFR